MKLTKKILKYFKKIIILYKIKKQLKQRKFFY